MSDDVIEHYGIKRRSGRYPYGSGKNPQRSRDFHSQVRDMKKRGMSEKQIANELGMSIADLRSGVTLAKQEVKAANDNAIYDMKQRGMSNTAIAEKLGISEGSVRNSLADSSKGKVAKEQMDNLVDQLRNSAERTGYLDVGAGVEDQLGVSRTKLNAALKQLEAEGYGTPDVYLKRLNDPDKSLTIKVLTKDPDIGNIVRNSDKIAPVEMHTPDGGLSFSHIRKPKSIGWDDFDIRYGDKGGADKDGLIEIRKGANKDLDLGNAKYAQVRIAVGGSHYLKGMAMYSDDLPKGVDVMFNTNKKSGLSKKDVLKKMSDDKFNPFGATIKPGGQRGALNIVNEEGDWKKWSNKLSSQFLSKQPGKLIKERLDATLKKADADFNEINSLTNPVVKKHLMGKYIDGLKSKATHLKAEGLPGTRGHVILPLTSLKPNEIYAPNYRNGDRVVAVRYPHGGIFELPELKVNNRNKQGKSLLGQTIDAVGIHPSVAQKLSGADFDGDTVYIIPNNQRKIKTAATPKALSNFDPNQYRVGHKTITPERKQRLMGDVSNLITDMTIKGAPMKDITNAVRHSMVVIDSEKHNLDHKQSAIDHNIKALRKRYQTNINPQTGRKSYGASTLISKKKRLIDTVDAKGKKQKVPITLFVKDARKLSSGSHVENEYANYINKLKARQNKAQKIYDSIPRMVRKPEAAKKYPNEIKSLNQKLTRARSNAPRERQAQLLASNEYYKKLGKNKDMGKDERKRLKSQLLAEARNKSGVEGSKARIDITPKEWKAIQAGAISNNKLESMLKYTDLDKLRELATPRQYKKLSPDRLARARRLMARGYSQSEVADALGISIETLRRNL